MNRLQIQEVLAELTTAHTQAEDAIQEGTDFMWCRGKQVGLELAHDALLRILSGDECGVDDGRASCDRPRGHLGDHEGYAREVFIGSRCHWKRS